MKKRFVKHIAVCLAVLICLAAVNFLNVFAQDEDAEDYFFNFLSELQEDGVVGEGGNTTYYGDYEDEWAQIDYYQWRTFEEADRFVISANISWASASDKPNNFSAGCGFVFNAGSGNANHLLASVRMDGNVYIDGARNHQYLSYGKYKYGPASTKGTTDFLMAVDRDTVTIYLDGVQIVRKTGLVSMGDAVAVATLSGTNKGYGTRCTYKDIFFYSW